MSDTLQHNAMRQLGVCAIASPRGSPRYSGPAVQIVGPCSFCCGQIYDGLLPKLL